MVFLVVARCCSFGFDVLRVRLVFFTFKVWLMALLYCAMLVLFTAYLVYRGSLVGGAGRRVFDC